MTKRPTTDPFRRARFASGARLSPNTMHPSTPTLKTRQKPAQALPPPWPWERLRRDLELVSLRGASFVEVLSCRVKSEANRRGHWTRSAGRTHDQRSAAAALFRAQLRRFEGAFRRAVVGIILVRPRKLDSDNRVSAVKAIRDGIADAFAVDDRDEERLVFLPVEWRRPRRDEAEHVEIRVWLLTRVLDTWRAERNGSRAPP